MQREDEHGPPDRAEDPRRDEDRDGKEEQVHGLVGVGHRRSDGDAGPVQRREVGRDDHAQQRCPDVTRPGHAQRVGQAVTVTVGAAVGTTGTVVGGEIGAVLTAVVGAAVGATGLVATTVDAGHATGAVVVVVVVVVVVAVEDVVVVVGGVVDVEVVDREGVDVEGVDVEGVVGVLEVVVVLEGVVAVGGVVVVVVIGVVRAMIGRIGGVVVDVGGEAAVRGGVTSGGRPRTGAGLTGWRGAAPAGTVPGPSVVGVAPSR